jgi:cyclic beta-1,2-glucan synthetase
MAHHQGMSLLALVNVAGRPDAAALHGLSAAQGGGPAAAGTFAPTAASVLAEDVTIRGDAPAGRKQRSVMRVFTQSRRRPAPEVHLLSNGRYHVVISSAGGGYSRWRDLAVTRWREDTTRDHWGTFVYLRDVATGEVLVHRPSTHPAHDQRLRSHFHPGARRVSATAMPGSKSTPRSACPRRTTWRCAASPSPIVPRHRASLN